MKVFTVNVPEYQVTTKPDYKAVGAIVDAVSNDVWRQQLKITTHGYAALCEQLANTPAPEVILPRRRD